MKHNSRTLLGQILIAIVFSTLPVAAQVNTSEIKGVIEDQTGAVMPAVQVKVSSPLTSFVRSTTTNHAGEYLLTGLPPGLYRLRVESKGFATIEQSVTLDVGRSLTLNFSPKPGSETQVVKVTEETPLVNTGRSEIGGSVSAREVSELPLLNRNFANLTTLVPGVRPAQNFDPTKTRTGNMSLNGGDGRQFDINVDGGSNKDNVVGGLVQNFTTEGIQEFNVVTNRYTAESGRTVGGIVNVVTKSGTNDFHGSMFGFFQNSGLNKNDQLNAEAGLPKPKFHRYQFGGSLGGPIVKARLFFFGAYEQKREPGNLPVLPDAFTELSLFPLAVPITTIDSTYLDHLGTAKVDWLVNDRQNISFRYGRQKWTQANDQLGNPFVTDLSQGTSNTNQFHDFTIQHDLQISNNKTNVMTLHFQDFSNGILPRPGSSFTYPIDNGSTATNPEIIFPSGVEIGQNANVPQTTRIQKYQLREDFRWSVNRHSLKMGTDYIYEPKLGGSAFFGANGYQVTFWDDPSIITSNTALYPNAYATPGAVQQLNFSGGNGSYNQKTHQLAFYFQDDFKVTNRLTLNLGLRWDANINFIPTQLGSTPIKTNRTIGILRQLLVANPTAPGTQEGLARANELAGNVNDLQRNTANWKEFQPRIGFAWDVTGNGSQVIRGGYGIAFDQIFQNLTILSIQQTHPNIYQTAMNLVATGRPGSCIGSPLCNFRFGTDPFPSPLASAVPDDLAIGALGFTLDPHATDPYAQQASIGWAWQFRRDYVFSADYYHVLGIKEPRVLQMNPIIATVCDPSFPGANPTDPRCVAGASTRLLDAAFQAAAVTDPTLVGAGRLGEVRDVATNNRSQYDGLNLQLKKRFSKNFTFQTSYVLSWSRSWGGRPTASYGGTAFAITPELQFVQSEFGPTGFDERHRFVLSGVFQLPAGFEAAPIFQAASARPYNFRANTDLDGDGRITLDRVCVGSTVTSPVLNKGCQIAQINSLRGDPFVEMDARFAKSFRFDERLSLHLYVEFYNLFNRANFGNNFGERVGTSTFNQPVGYFGIGSPDIASTARGFSGDAPVALRTQFGVRFEF